jgi:hypothetical protein
MMAALPRGYSLRERARLERPRRVRREGDLEPAIVTFDD